MRDLLAIDEGWLDGRLAQARAWLAAGHVVDVSPEAAAKLVPARRGSGSVAIIPVSGFLTQKQTLFSFLFGGTSVDALASEVVGAMRDTSISAVVLDVDSPGGSVHGIPEAAAKIRAARGPKPLYAVANPMMASAAYWIASQADEVIVSPSGLAGSIGVLLEHVDMSAALEREGVKVSVIRYGRNKAMGHPAEPMSEDARGEMQSTVDHFGRLFDSDVAKGRKVSVEKVRSDFGEGKVFTAEAAASAGLADRVGTIEDVVRSAMNAKPAAEARAYDPAEIAAHAALAGLR